VKRALFGQVQALLADGVHFDEVWVEAGGGEELSPLFAEEASIVERAVAKRQREFRAGRHVARCALVGAGGPSTALLRGGHGEPLFPTGYRGSITHTGREDTYAAAVATRAPWLLGIDAEMHAELSADLVRRVADAEEVSKAARVSPEPGLLVFAAKEAAYKCVYPLCGRMLAFEEVRLVGVRDSALQLQVLALQDQPVVEVRWLRDQGITLCLATLPFGRVKPGPT
jgi:4'-phosphopantetheinyl transferase EntD